MPTIATSVTTIARGELLGAAERSALVVEAQATMPTELAGVPPAALERLLILAEQAILSGLPLEGSWETRRLLLLQDAVRDVFQPQRRGGPGNTLLIEELKVRRLRETLEATLTGKPLAKWAPQARELLRVVKAILRGRERTSYGSLVVTAALEEELTAAFANCTADVAKVAA